MHARMHVRTSAYVRKADGETEKQKERKRERERERERKNEIDQTFHRENVLKKIRTCTPAFSYDDDN